MSPAAEFEVLEELGQGASGSTYKVQPPGTTRPVALKRIVLTAFPENEREALREAVRQGVNQARGLSHPGIASVIDVVEEPEAVCVRRDLVDGLSLASLCASNSLPANAPLLHFLRQTAEALDFAHRRGVIHGTLKPADILITVGSATAERRAKITDFGLAPFLSMLQRLGRLELSSYTSPEQRTSGALDARSDQYSLAATIYGILCGKPPSSVPAEQNGHSEPIQELNATLSASADKVLKRALSADPAERFQSCASFVSTLGIALSENPGWAPARVMVSAPETPLDQAEPAVHAEPDLPKEAGARAGGKPWVEPPPPTPGPPVASEPELEPTASQPRVETPIPEPPVLESAAPEPATPAAAPVIEDTIYWPIPDEKLSAVSASAPLRDSPAPRAEQSTEQFTGSVTPEPASPPKPRPIMLPMMEDEAATEVDGIPPAQTRESELAARRRRHAYYGESDEEPEEVVGRKKSIVPKILVGLVACLALLIFVLYEMVWRPRSDLPTQVLDTTSGVVTAPPADDALPAAQKSAPNRRAWRQVPVAPADASARSFKSRREVGGAGIAQEEFISEPAGAKITIDGNRALSCTTPCNLSLPSGRHTAALESPGFSEARRIFSVPEDNSLFIPLTRSAGILVLTSTPSGSTIVVDGRNQGQTPATLHLSSGKHQVVLLYGAMRHEETVNIETDGFQARSLNWETP